MDMDDVVPDVRLVVEEIDVATEVVIALDVIVELTEEELEAIQDAGRVTVLLCVGQVDAEPDPLAEGVCVA